MAVKFGEIQQSSGLLQPLILRCWVLFPLGIKWPRREDDLSPAATAEVKMVELYINSPRRFHCWVLNQSIIRTLKYVYIPRHSFFPPLKG
jgi:hypothetical protein